MVRTSYVLPDSLRTHIHAIGGACIPESANILQWLIILYPSYPFWMACQRSRYLQPSCIMVPFIPVGWATERDRCSTPGPLDYSLPQEPMLPPHPPPTIDITHNCWVMSSGNLDGCCTIGFRARSGNQHYKSGGLDQDKGTETQQDLLVGLIWPSELVLPRF